MNENRRKFLIQAGQGLTAFFTLGEKVFPSTPFKMENTIESEEGKLHEVESAGTPYEIGRQYSGTLGDIFTNHVKTSVEGLSNQFSKDPMHKALDFMLNGLRRDFPYLVEEMRGMADGAKLTFEEVALTNLGAGLAAFIKNKGDRKSDCGCPSGQGFDNRIQRIDGCTNILFPRSDHGPIMGRTLDASIPRVGTDIVRWIRPKKGYALLCVSRTNGLSTVHGINEKGLGVGEASLHFPTINPKGIIRNILPRLLLQECTTVEQGIRFLSKFPVLRHGFHYTLVDGNGHAAVVERSPTEMVARRSKDKPVFCTNHAATPSMRKLELSRGTTGDKNSDARYARLQSLVSSPDFEMTLHQMKSMLQDHRVPGGICQHGDLDMYTQRAFLALVNEKKLLVTNGPACRHEYKEYRLKG